MKQLEEIIFDEFDKMGITPTNSEWRLTTTLSKAIQRWITEEFADNLQKWLIEDYEPARLRFNLNMVKEFPKTFNSIVSKEEPSYIDKENIEEAEYEEIKD